MATAAAKATKEASAGQSNPAQVRKSKFTEFWEKYPEGTLIVYDRKAVMK